MKKLIIYFLIGAILAVMVMSVKAYPQEVSIFAPDPNQAAAIGDEVQDEGELASALGIDRRALYEDLMRIQEELGGSPLGPFSEQNADGFQDQEQEQDY